MLADAPPFEVPYQNAKDPINNQIEYFPEFANYQIYEGKFIPEKKNSGLIDAFRFVGSGLGSLATYLGSKYQEHDMNNKLIEGGAATLKGLAVAGKMLYKIAKPVVKYASIRAVQGVGYLCKQAEFQLSDDEYDDNEEDEEDKKVKKNENKNEKKKNKKNKKKKKKDKEITINPETNNSFVLIDGNNYLFEPCVDYPSFESINKIQNNNYNNNNQNYDINYNNQNNNINNNYQNNNINNNYQNNNINNNMNMNPLPINNNQKPEFVIPPGLDCSEASIIGEKEI